MLLVKILSSTAIFASLRSVLSVYCRSLTLFPLQLIITAKCSVSFRAHWPLLCRGSSEPPYVINLKTCSLLAVLSLLLVVSASVSASPVSDLTPEQVASIDRFVAAEMARERIPGLAIGIYSRGKILLAKGYGLSNIELNVPVKPETVFQSGSVGKQFVSAAIMMLVEEGKIGLDDSIAKYFPNAPKSWQTIKVKNLLSHTSGLAEYESDERTGPPITCNNESSSPSE